MKKQNVLDLLCDDLISQYEKENYNFYTCVNDNEIWKNAKRYILPFIESNLNMFKLDFNFDIYATDELVKYKSMILFVSFITETTELIASMPKYFKEYEKKYNTELAYNEICLRVFIGNILDIRKGLNKISNVKHIDKELQEKLNNLCNDIKDL